MTAYVVIIRDKLNDPSHLEKYASIAKEAPISKLEIIASKTCPFEVLEGDPAKAVVILRFPSMDDAKEWYFSEAYQRALPHRQTAAEDRVIIVDGVD